jgi:hypothetical protein
MRNDDTRCKRRLEIAAIQRHKLRMRRCALGLLFSQHVDVRAQLDESTNARGVAAIRGEVKGGVSAGTQSLRRAQF